LPVYGLVGPSGTKPGSEISLLITVF